MQKVYHRIVGVEHHLSQPYRLKECLRNGKVVETVQIVQGNSLRHLRSLLHYTGNFMSTTSSPALSMAGKGSVTISAAYVFLLKPLLGLENV